MCHTKYCILIRYILFKPNDIENVFSFSIKTFLAVKIVKTYLTPLSIDFKLNTDCILKISPNLYSKKTHENWEKSHEQTFFEWTEYNYTKNIFQLYPSNRLTYILLIWNKCKKYKTVHLLFMFLINIIVFMLLRIYK